MEGMNYAACQGAYSSAGWSPEGQIHKLDFRAPTILNRGPTDNTDD